MPSSTTSLLWLLVSSSPCAWQTPPTIPFSVEPGSGVAGSSLLQCGSVHQRALCDLGTTLTFVGELGHGPLGALGGCLTQCPIGGTLSTQRLSNFTPLQQPALPHALNANKHHAASSTEQQAPPAAGVLDATASWSTEVLQWSTTGSNT
jgi:hypothetical protein